MLNPTGPRLTKEDRDKILRVIPQPLAGSDQRTQEVIDLAGWLVVRGYIMGYTPWRDFPEDLRLLGVWDHLKPR